MVELQLINKIINRKSLSIVRQQNMDERYFITYKAEFMFIVDHYSKYDVVPDKETFIRQFPEFDFLIVEESDQYLIETVQEQFMYSIMVPIVHTIAEMVQTDAREAVKFARRGLEDVMKQAAGFTQGTDLVKASDDRKQEYKTRLEVEGLLGVPTGLEELDKLTHGWLAEDFILILGRTNEGKSWVLLFFLVAAWISGVPVLLYSGEMSSTVVGFRFDTWNGHFRNLALMNGENNLDDEDWTKEQRKPEDYFKYLDDLKTNPTPFVVVTPKNLGGRRLDIPMLHELIEQHKPGIVGIDQVSLMDDYRKDRGDQRRMELTHLGEDLYLTSEKYGIPIMSPTQATRQEKKDSEDTPELDQIFESDGLGQNATRVISIKQLGKMLKIAIKKNRYGLNNRELMVIWDIDKGIIRPFLQTETNDRGEAVNATQLTGTDLF